MRAVEFVLLVLVGTCAARTQRANVDAKLATLSKKLADGEVQADCGNCKPSSPSPMPITKAPGLAEVKATKKAPAPSSPAPLTKAPAQSEVKATKKAPAPSSPAPLNKAPAQSEVKAKKDPAQAAAATKAPPTKVPYLGDAERPKNTMANKPIKKDP